MVVRLLLALCALCLIPAAPAAAQTAAEQAAQQLQALVGQKFGGNISVAAVTAEANTLIITIDAVDGWPEGLSPANISRAFLDGFCKDATAAVFFQSGWVRVDSLDRGTNPRRGEPANICPSVSNP